MIRMVIFCEQAVQDFEACIRDYKRYLSADPEDMSVGAADRQAATKELAEVTQLLKRKEEEAEAAAAAAARQKPPGAKDSRRGKKQAPSMYEGFNPTNYQGFEVSFLLFLFCGWQIFLLFSLQDFYGFGYDMDSDSDEYEYGRPSRGGSNASQGKPTSGNSSARRPETGTYGRSAPQARGQKGSEPFKSAAENTRPAHPASGGSSGTSNSGARADAAPKNTQGGGGARRHTAWQEVGRSEKAAPQTHYSLLGVPMTATEKEIKTAYRQLALKYHPDKNKDEGAIDIFKSVTEAYSVLLDKVRP